MQPSKRLLIKKSPPMWKSHFHFLVGFHVHAWKMLFSDQPFAFAVAARTVCDLRAFRFRPLTRENFWSICRHFERPRRKLLAGSWLRTKVHSSQMLSGKVYFATLLRLSSKRNYSRCTWRIAEIEISIPVGFGRALIGIKNWLKYQKSLLTTLTGLFTAYRDLSLSLRDSWCT